MDADDLKDLAATLTKVRRRACIDVSALDSMAEQELAVALALIDQAVAHLLLGSLHQVRALASMRR